MLLLWLSAAAWAQEPATEDSVMVMGTVVNQMTAQPEPYSVVHLLQEERLVASAPCDSEGWFEMPLLPAGSYRLEVMVRGLTLYQSDLVLQQNAELNIGVITDSLRLVNLREVRIMALRHLLGAQYIASPSDIRIWNMHMRKGGGDHSASVSISPDMDPEWDETDDDPKGGVLRLVLPVGIPGRAWKYYTSGRGLTVAPDNSDMKNELLGNGRIRDVKRRAPADSTQKK